MATILPEPVDQNGNISYALGEGINIPISEIDDATEAPVDLSALNRVFKLSGQEVVGALQPDGGNLRLILTPLQLQPITTAVPFVYLDTDGPVPISLWEGVIFRRSQ